MKKVLFTLAIALIFIADMDAQVDVGVKGGVNFASILGENLSGLKGRTSFNVGLFAEKELSSASAVQLELLYSGQGFSYEGGTINGEVVNENTFKLNYLNLPILYKYYFSEGFSIEFGPQIGFLLAANAENETGIDGDLKDNLTTASFDLALGLGYKFENGFNVNARYTYGLTDIWKGVDDTFEDYYYYYDYGQRNGVFQITVGYIFN